MFPREMGGWFDIHDGFFGDAKRESGPGSVDEAWENSKYVEDSFEENSYTTRSIQALESNSGEYPLSLPR